MEGRAESVPAVVEHPATSPNGGAAIARPFRTLRVGLMLDDRLTWEGWTEIGTKISGYADASSWWLGDWLVFGERRYGSRYADAIVSSGARIQDAEKLRHGRAAVSAVPPAGQR